MDIEVEATDTGLVVDGDPPHEGKRAMKVEGWIYLTEAEWRAYSDAGAQIGIFIKKTIG